jgi:hypothetical protein
MTTFCPECGKQINDANGCRWCNITKKSMPNSDFINSVLKNPCEGCKGKDYDGCVLWENKNDCPPVKDYKCDINQTKVVFEWLRSESETYGFRQMERTFESLLKQLEEMER